MVTSLKMKSQIKKWEGLRLKAYKAVKTEQHFTIGYGHYGPDVYEGMEITEEEADRMFDNDLRKYERYVEELNRPWTQGQYDALVSFTYNCGKENLKMLTSGRTPLEISERILLYTKSGGKELKGLVKRRKIEQEYFISDSQPLKTIDQIAVEVLDRKWGNGMDRKNRITAAGYDYSKVQQRVNELIMIREKNQIDLLLGH